MTLEPYYEDDFVTLYLGDCREATAWLTADVLVTDPPYGMDHYLTTTERVGAHGEMRGDADTAVRDAALTAWGSRPAVVFGHWRRPRPDGVRHLVVWNKPNRRMAMGPPAPFVTTHEEIYFLGEGFRPGRRPTVVAWDAPGTRHHPTPKPLALLHDLIDACPDGVIADPFAGSGTTLRAAKDRGRRAIGVEIEERYCEVIAERLGGPPAFSDDSLFGGVA